MQISGILDTYPTLVKKLSINQGNNPGRTSLVTSLLQEIIRSMGGTYGPSQGETEYILWAYILLNQCGPLFFSPEDTQYTIIEKILINQNGPYSAGWNDTQTDLVRKMVNNQILLQNCNASNSMITVAGEVMVTVAGETMVTVG